MIAPKYLAAAVILAAPMVLAGAPAQAFSARQASSQGQGTFVTSSGMPSNFVGNASVPQQNQDAKPLRSLEHHNRYFANQ